VFVGVSGGNVLSPSVQVFQAAGSATLDAPTREAGELSKVRGPGAVTCAAVDDGRDIPTFMRGRNNYIEADSRSTRTLPIGVGNVCNVSAFNIVSADWRPVERAWSRPGKFQAELHGSRFRNPGQRRRHRLSHANVGCTTHRRGTLAASERLTIFTEKAQLLPQPTKTDPNGSRSFRTDTHRSCPRPAEARLDNPKAHWVMLRAQGQPPSPLPVINA
jgi:hypothetical protein